MSPGVVDVDELPADLRRQLGVQKPRRASMSKDEIRSAAIRVLNVIASLSKAQRRRVLEHALRVNEV